MDNRRQIQNLKDYAELAWASYGYFDLIEKKFNIQDIENTDRKSNPTITLHDILDSTYYGYETEDSSFFDTLKLKGDFTPTQAKNFFEHYELLEYCPNTDSGFSGSLFEKSNYLPNR